MANYQRRGLTVKQWSGWMAYLSLFPLPHDRADFNAAFIRGTALNCAGVKKVKIAELLPKYGQRAKRRTGEELKAIAMAMVPRKSE